MSSEVYEFENDRLLPGEPPTSNYVEDAAHWVTVYAELSEYLSRSQIALEGTLERYQRRLAFWRLRLDELDGGPHGTAD